MSTQEWTTQFLNNRALTLPDERPLFQYRTNSDEYASLSAVLKSNPIRGGTNWAKHYHWAACFVFYAAEWWCREYAGHWSWEGIFSSLDLDAEDFAPSTRNDIITLGLWFWKRPIRRAEAGQRMFLGTIAAEGGLPLKQLAKAEGWMSHLFRVATRRYLQFGSLGISPEAIIRQQEEYIPQAYRKSSFFVVFGDVIQAVADLRTEFSLGTSSTPVAELNEKCPDWRNRFPLPLDSEVATNLLSEILTEASKTTLAGEYPKPVLLRRLVEESPRNFSLETKISIPQKLFVNEESLPQRIDLEASDSLGKTWRIGVAYSRKVDGGHALLPTNTEAKLVGAKPNSAISFTLRHAGVAVASIPLTGGEPLQEDQPWMFIEKSPEYWVLTGQAGCSTNYGGARIVVPQELEIRENDNCLLELIGKANNGYVYNFAGRISVKDNHIVYSLQTDATDSNDLFYSVSGKCCKFSQSVDTYYGKPTVYRHNIDTGTSQAITTGVHFDPITITQNLKSEEPQYGLFYCTIEDEGNTLFRRKVGILPEHIDIRGIPSAQSDCGQLIVSEHQNATIGIDDTNITVEKKESPSGLTFTLSARDNLPTSFIANFYWEGTRPIPLMIPFPIRGAELFSPNGHRSANSSLYRDALHGYRIRLFDNSKRKQDAYIHLTLSDSELMGSTDIALQHVIPIADGSIELSLIDFKRDLNELFSVATDLDAKVRFEVVVDGAIKKKFDILQYGLDLDIDQVSSHVGIPQEELSLLQDIDADEIELSSLFLDTPELPLVELKRVGNQTESICWHLGDIDTTEAPLLLMTSENSPIQCKPRFLKSQYLPAATDTERLKDAMLLSGKAMRFKAITAILDAMVKDNQHPDWKYLRQLYTHCSHIPMATFEVFACCCNSPETLASLALHMPSDFIRGFSDSFPVVWELVDSHSWRKGLSVIQKAIPEALREDQEYISTVMQTYYTNIEATDSYSMRGVREVLAEGNKLSEALVLHFISGNHTTLLQSHANDSWPEDLAWSLENHISKLPKAIQSLIPEDSDFRRPVITLPFVLAALFWQQGQCEWIGNAKKLFKIKKLINFDKLWFDGTFPYLVSYFGTILEEN